MGIGDNVFAGMALQFGEQAPTPAAAGRRIDAGSS